LGHREAGGERILDEADNEPLGLERAGLDVVAVVAAEHGARLADQALRRAVQRHLVLVGRRARAVDYGLVITGEETVELVVRLDAHRLEIILEELARRLAVDRPRRGERPGRLAGGVEA